MREGASFVDSEVRTAMNQFGGLVRGQAGDVRGGTDRVETEGVW